MTVCLVCGGDCYTEQSAFVGTVEEFAALLDEAYGELRRLISDDGVRYDEGED